MSESDSKKQKEKSQSKSKETYALYSLASLKKAVKDYKDKIAKFSVEDLDIEEFLEKKAENFDKREIAKVFFYVRECEEYIEIIGFFCLSLKGIPAKDLSITKNCKRKLFGGYSKDDETILSFILIGQLGVDKKFQGQGFGTEILVEVGKLGKQASKMFGGLRAILVDARNDERVKSFYEKNGFFQTGKAMGDTVSMMAFIKTLS